MAELTKKERESLIGKISYKSGVTKMALSRLSDEQLTQAAKDLEAFANIKSAVTWMQHHQRTFTEVANLKTKEAESKLANFLNSENSEILNAGKWLLGALSKSGKERKQTRMAEGWF